MDEYSTYRCALSLCHANQYLKNTSSSWILYFPSFSQIKLEEYHTLHQCNKPCCNYVASLEMAAKWVKNCLIWVLSSIIKASQKTAYLELQYFSHMQLETQSYQCESEWKIKAYITEFVSRGPKIHSGQFYFTVYTCSAS